MGSVVVDGAGFKDVRMVEAFQCNLLHEQDGQGSGVNVRSNLKGVVAAGAGFKEVRMVEARPGIAFVELENDMQASVAMTGLQSFRITPTNAMAITYAKV